MQKLKLLDMLQDLERAIHCTKKLEDISKTVDNGTAREIADILELCQDTLDEGILWTKVQRLFNRLEDMDEDVDITTIGEKQ